MPVRVNCPNGCSFHVPESRAGKVVRCPECKSAIRLSTVVKRKKKKSVSGSLHRSTEPLESSEPSPKSTSSDIKEATDTSQSLDKSAAPDQLPTPAPPALSPTDQPASTPASRSPTKRKKKKKNSRLAMPESLHPLPQLKPTEPAPAIDSGEKEPEQIIPAMSPALRERMEKKKAQAAKKDTDPNSRDLKPPKIDPHRFGDQFLDRDERLLKRVKSSNAERVTLARFFAICLCIVGLINVVPAVYFWYQWSMSEAPEPLARWIYMQVFVATLHFIYAIYLVQIPDWSALRMVALAMLAVAAVFGLVSTGLLVGGHDGSITKFMGLPYVMVKGAGIWCVAMLCLATLMTYLSGRESLNWQRTEQLLREILAGQSQTENQNEPNESTAPTI